MLGPRSILEQLFEFLEFTRRDVRENLLLGYLRPRVQIIVQYPRTDMYVKMGNFETIVRNERPVVLRNIATRRDRSQDFLLKSYRLIEHLFPFIFCKLAELLDVTFGYDEQMSRHQSGIAQNDNAVFVVSYDSFLFSSPDIAKRTVHCSSIVTENEFCIIMALKGGKLIDEDNQGLRNPYLVRGLSLRCPLRHI